MEDQAHALRPFRLLDALQAQGKLGETPATREQGFPTIKLVREIRPGAYRAILRAFPVVAAWFGDELPGGG